MDTKPTKNSEPKAKSLPDLSPTQDEAKDVKGGACATGTHYPEPQIRL